MSEWIEIGRVDDIPRLGARVVRAPEGDIAVFRTDSDDVYALRDSCPHKGGPLSQGIVHDCRIACPLHNWVLDLKTGEAVGPDEGHVKIYPVKVEDGVISLCLKQAEQARECA